MGLKGKLIAEFEVKSSAYDFHDQFRHKPHHISAFSTIVEGCELVSGEWGKSGCIIRWDYIDHDGKTLSATEELEFDEEKKKIILKVIGGHVKEEFKSLVLTLETIVQDGLDTDLIRWTIDYEKLHEDVAHPTRTLDVLINVTHHVEAEHSKTA